MKKLSLGPKAALALFLLLLGLPGLFLTRLVVDNSPEIYFPYDNRAVAYERELRKSFPNDQFIYVLLQGKDVYQAEVLRHLGVAVQRLERDSRIERVLSVVSSDHIRADAMGFAIEPLVDVGKLHEHTPAQWRERVLSDRFAIRALAGSDGESLGILVRPRQLSNSYNRQEIQQTVERVLQEEKLGPWVTGMAGPVPLDVAQFESLIRDNLVFSPLTTAMVLLVMWLLFRSRGVVGWTLAAILTVSPLPVVLLIAFNRPYTMVDSMVMPLTMALTASLLVHLWSAMRLAYKAGLHGEAAVDYAVALVRRPSLLATVMAFLGLSSLALTPITPIRDFGLSAGAGALLGYLVVMHLLPPILGRWFRGNLTHDAQGMHWIDVLIAHLPELGIRRAGLVIAGVAVVTAIAFALISQIRVDTDMVRFFEPDHPLTRATTTIESKIAGVTPMEIVVKAGEHDALKNPALLKTLAGLRLWLESQPEIDRAVALSDVVEEMHRAFNEGDEAYRTIPDDPNLIAQYLLLYDGRDLFDLVNHDFDTARIVMSVNVHETSKVVALVQRLEAHLATLKQPAVSYQVAGFGRLLADQEALLVQGQISSLSASLLTIFLTFAIMFRSLKAGLICLLPNLSPVVFTYAILVAVGMRLDIATALIASVAIGVAVEDTIHLYNGYLTGKRRAYGTMRSLLLSYRHAGGPSVATTLMLLMTFALFGFSSFRPTQHFGLLTLVGLFGAMCLNLLLLPALLTMWDRAAQRGTARSAQATV